MHYSLDLSGYICPIPLLTTKKAMTDLKKGDSLEILLNKQSSLADFELLAQERNWQFEIIEQAVGNRVIFAVLG